MRKWATIVIAAMVFVLVVLLLVARKNCMPANVVFGTPGKYWSPSGRCYADITRLQNGRLKFSVHRPAKKSVLELLRPFGSGGSGDSQSPTAPFSADSGWYMCWDEKDRLWTFLPQNRVECWYFNETVVGSCLVGSRGRVAWHTVRVLRPIAGECASPEAIVRSLKKGRGLGRITDHFCHIIATWLGGLQYVRQLLG